LEHAARTRGLKNGRDLGGEELAEDRRHFRRGREIPGRRAGAELGVARSVIAETRRVESLAHPGVEGQEVVGFPRDHVEQAGLDLAAVSGAGLVCLRQAFGVAGQGQRTGRWGSHSDSFACVSTGRAGPRLCGGGTGSVSLRRITRSAFTMESRNDTSSATMNATR